MSKFVTKTIAAVRGLQEFRQLVILPDNFNISQLDIQNIEGQLDIYERTLEVKYSSSFKRILAIMDEVAKGNGVSKQQWKDVTPAKELIKEYEIKAGDLRVFAIKIYNGKLIILGGFKNQQKSDFKRFRSLKKQYLESLKK